MSKQRIVLGAVLALGMTVLVVDRVVLSSPATGPQSAAAHVAATQAESLLIASDDAVQPELDDGPASRTGSLAARLQQTAAEHNVGQQPVRDAFAPVGIVQVRPAQADAAAVDDEAIRAFRQRYRLMAVMTPGEGGVIVLNDRPMRVGRQVDGFTLVHVARHSAAFQSPDGQLLTLRLDPERPQ